MCGWKATPCRDARRLEPRCCTHGRCRTRGGVHNMCLAQTVITMATTTRCRGMCAAATFAEYGIMLMSTLLHEHLLDHRDATSCPGGRADPYVT